MITQMVCLLPIIAETMKNKKSSSMLIVLKFLIHERHESNGTMKQLPLKSYDVNRSEVKKDEKK